MQTSNEIKGVVGDWINRAVENIHTALPAVVISYDSGNNRASVQPCGFFKAKDGRNIKYPVIYNVPVVFPTGANGTAGITFPIKSGDGCLVVFSETQIDDFLSGGDSQDFRNHSMNDAIVIPGLYSNGATSNVSYPDETVLTCGGSTVRLSGGHLIISLGDGTSATFSGGDLVISGISSVHHTHMGVHGETSPPL